MKTTKINKTDKVNQMNKRMNKDFYFIYSKVYLNYLQINSGVAKNK